MQTRLALNDGQSLPQLGFGLWQVPQDQTARVVREGLAAGYRLIDGAAIYGNEAGLGEGLRSTDVARDEIFVTTKVWNDHHGHDAARRAADESLKRIGVDYLDCLLIHWPCPDHDRYVETWRALIELRAEGRVRSIGVSNFMAPHLERLVGETGVAPVLNQIELHPRLAQADLRALHRRMGIVTQSWTPLGQGRSFDAPAVQAAAARTGKTPAQVILRWHLQLGCAVIPRSTRAAGLAENLDLFGFALTDDDMAAIARLDAAERTGPDPLLFS
ncbi:aldo/keto reductase [Paragemmobacter straminiformis]|uniref:Aldo/keto reductase n=1 Tax=Paragemmobacter straminiformis TaxID=2045119 RepID=A0A842IDV7_9RHOB|nr:aldo/keto reductase [Gemmobacter straminiformis]MBC2837483.1 aldo/keto reductase [Gemmobacter straminiformis]